MINIKGAQTKELVQFYNDKVPDDKQIKKFKDRKTAEERCLRLVKLIKQKKKETVGSFIREGIMQGLKADEIVKGVKERFPKSKSTKKDVGYWRFILRKEGTKIPDSHYKQKPKEK